MVRPHLLNRSASLKTTEKPRFAGLLFNVLKNFLSDDNGGARKVIVSGVTLATDHREDDSNSDSGQRKQVYNGASNGLSTSWNQAGLSIDNA
jgi:hypothetical protein